MGSDNSYNYRAKIYNRYHCFKCGPCNDRGYYSCDDCSASCCRDSMSNHRDLFNLNDDFNKKIDYAIKDVCQRCDEIKSNLYNSYDIYIYYSYSSFDSIYQCNEFLNKMKEKKNDFENRLNNSEIPTIKRNFENTLNILRREHEAKLNRMRNEFLEKKEKCSFTKDRNLEIKTEEKNKLENEKYKINENQDKIIQKYENQERSKAETEFNKNKNEINQKYPNIEEKLEYTEDELRLKQQYIEEIQKIKPYTSNPLFNNFICSAGLYKYI
jgi:hypothetical protein